MKNLKNFQDYLERLQSARIRTQSIRQCWTPSSETVQASLACAWELFFELLRQQEGLSLADLNTLSGIIQKLSACHSQLSALEAKKSEELPGDGMADAARQLSPEMLEALERQLQLL